ncbi:hypothetical protein [Neobacillus piezotolerans]|uniref:hypothetical protein n=1 Tax=Neobacillus piezotolerans TaxID=2259171 RepID=UPI0011590938|nr:hypothetical protein [Neobacillus piezotolerans]
MFLSFRDAFRLYTGRFEGVLLLSLTIVLPLLLGIWFLNNIVYFFVFDEFTSAIADFYYIFLTFSVLMIAQVPFIEMVKSYAEEGDYKYRNIYYAFFTTAFSIFLFAIAVSLAATVGTMFFIIPGLILLVFFFTAPYESVMSGKSIWKSIKPSFTFAKKKFFPLLSIILFISLVEIIIGWIGMYVIYSVTASLLAQITVQMLLNLVFFPFLSIWIAFYYLSWKEGHQLAPEVR